MYRHIIIQHYNQLSVGPKVQLVEHWTGIAEVRIQIPIGALIFQAFLATI